MTIEMFRRLFEYDHWGNMKALESIRLATLEPSSRTCAIVAHLVGAARLWSDRLAGRTSTAEAWPALTLDECEAAFHELHDSWRAYLDSLKPGDLDRTITYVNSKGEHWESTIGDVLMHVSLHGSYHRGQIATAVRAAGSTPAYTDYIEARRRGLVT